jgi:hypothetical protein
MTPEQATRRGKLISIGKLRNRPQDLDKIAAQVQKVERLRREFRKSLYERTK